MQQKTEKVDQNTHCDKLSILSTNANGSTNPDVFYPKTFSIPRGIIPQNFRSLGFAVSEELGNIQTHTQTHSLTDWCFDRVITF